MVTTPTPISTSSALILQDSLKFTDQVSLLFGARVDILYVDAQSPAGTPHKLRSK